MSGLNDISCAYENFVTSYTTIIEKRVFKKPTKTNAFEQQNFVFEWKHLFHLKSPHPSSPNIVAKRFVNCLFLECVRARDQKPWYLCYETKGGICIKIEFNPQKKHGRRFFVYSSNVAAVTSSKHMLFACFQHWKKGEGETTFHEGREEKGKMLVIFMCQQLLFTILGSKTMIYSTEDGQ